MRVATWNVERPKPNGWKIPQAQLRRMADVNAEVWVLTETNLHHQPSAEHEHVLFSPEYPERRPSPERWTAIWSRWPLTPIVDPAAHRRGTVAAVVAAPSGDLIVYGTVIAYAGEPNEDGESAPMWEVHKKEITRQGAEWAQLRASHPNVPLVVAGDFNQNRDGARWYGTKDTRARLGVALDLAGLKCVTDADMVVNGQLKAHHLIDHICLTPDLAAGAAVSCRENIDATGQRLSDHPVVIVDLV